MGGVYRVPRGGGDLELYENVLRVLRGHAVPDEVRISINTNQYKKNRPKF